jgi:Uma2 family endonuclease
MAMTTTSELFPGAIVTGELLEHLTGLPDRYELVEGRIVPLTPCNVDHAQAVAHLAALLYNRLDRAAWIILSGEAGLYTQRRPDYPRETVRGADLAVISKARKAERDPHRAFLTVAPELVIEVLTPGNDETDIHAKVQEYLTMGVQMVWLIELATRQVNVMRMTGGTIHPTPGGPTLTLPDGTSLNVVDLFPE